MLFFPIFFLLFVAVSTNEEENLKINYIEPYHNHSILYFKILMLSTFENEEAKNFLNFPIFTTLAPHDLNLQTTIE